MEIHLIRVALGSLLAVLASTGPGSAQDEEVALSEASEGCIFCHENLHPGLVADWRRSRHARTTVARALAVDEPARRVSAAEVPVARREVAVGCAECHGLRADAHPDTVEHGDAAIHAVVSPADCAVCHPVEVEQFGGNLMAHAHDNLLANPLFVDLMERINGVETWEDGALVARAPHPLTGEDSCLSCHGTRLEVVRTETRDTGLGEMEFAVLSGWPNQGVGRVNPDGSLGACTACHTRHEFSIAMARKPHTCAQCHKGPDVPAYKVYQVSKHGSSYESRGGGWDFEAVPWHPGEHFTAPTCATCHISLLAGPDDAVLVPRTHRMNDRLGERLFGLPYAHAHPADPRTHRLRNAAGQPLPTGLDGEPAPAGLIDAAERAGRRAELQKVCQACHTRNWIDGHFARLDLTIETTDASTRTATAILGAAWRAGVASGSEAGGSLFDEPLERLWVEHWLFFANSTRFAAAMSGADYGVFADGRFAMARNLREMEALLKLQGGGR
jgi:hypothetical protein